MYTYFRILLQVLVILLVAFLAIAGIISDKAVIFGCLGIGMTFILIGILAYDLQASNRRIRLFLDAVRDNESTLFFPENTGSKEERHLHASFNRINTLLAELRLESCQQEHFYRALLQHIPGGVVSWNEAGQIKIVNDVALSLLGCSLLRYIDQLEQIIPDFQGVLREIAVNEVAMVEIRREHQVRQLSLSLSHIVLRNEEITILVLKDIGRELGRKEYESWDRLTHVLTHEIMNSIAPVVSLSNTLFSYYQTDGNKKTGQEITDLMISKTLRGLDTIRKQGQGLMHFTDSFRRLSFIKEPVPKLFSLSRLIQRLQLLFHADLERQQIVLTIELYRPDIELMADEELLSQVLVNLLRNATQALIGQLEGNIKIRVSRESMMTIEIIDDGPGISEDIREDIFVPFFTTKSQGTGIGLSLSRQIIRMHGGDLQVSSIPFSETRFIISLPLVRK